MTVTESCKGYCPDRSASCHATCQKYAAYRAQLEERKEMERMQRLMPIRPVYLAVKQISKGFAPGEGERG